jgi:hypothetical protein
MTAPFPNRPFPADPHAGESAEPDGVAGLPPRRCCPTDAAGEDVHTGHELCPARPSCRWPALSRYGAAAQPHHGAWLHQAARDQQTAPFEAGLQFAREEGILPAPQANHAVKGAIDEALKCRLQGVSRCILFNPCGHGQFDMQDWRDDMDGKPLDRQYDVAEITMALAGLPSVVSAPAVSDTNMLAGN